MVEVIVERNDQNEIISFELSGHANSGPYGHDLVCAAASAVSFGAINSIISLCNVEPEIEQGEKGGYLKMTLSSQMDDESFTKAQTLLEGMIVSIQTIENDYGEYIKLSTQ
ncbi:ribosomal-processing cysteine protease Prp [Allobacillus sp. GCM10007491]|uniref:Ribosomal processing cysteine protease Prp n=1 Tax=Allobacillus saliphilus TaxID=2912308 RepID=A0A941CT33_9BACI|nr:ribosomal-processing cysteine protease Prp [Allobacillus saliphilus]MBR7553412.1 ribosomal-processing cysteine protease Prp [Allobacillus saliphilus]